MNQKWIMPLLMVSALSMTFSVEARKPENGKTPPAAAIETCQGETDGDSCTMTGKEGDNLEGTCRTVSTGEFACVPNHHKRDKSGHDHSAH